MRSSDAAGVKDKFLAINISGHFSILQSRVEFRCFLTNSPKIMDEIYSPEKSLADKLITLKCALTITVCIIGVVSLLANLLILLLMLKVKKLKENPANSFIISIIIVDLIFGVWFAFSIAFKAGSFIVPKFKFIQT
jgi:hypothetical protein